ncbi:YraN family protein [Patescibacteria group bacterium]|nr:MAG: YraN family protein [Patescibacteria group bacterium]
MPPRAPRPPNICREKTPDALPMEDARRARGSFGESVAARLFLEKGFTILERGWRTRYGEVDLIVQDARGVRFVEVKTRGSDTFGPPEEAVTRLKLRKIARVAEVYLEKRGWQHLARQIDVVAIRTDAPGAPEVRHIEDVGEGFG